MHWAVSHLQDLFDFHCLWVSGCGFIFCDDCSDNRLYCLPWALGQESRVCNSCFGGAFFVPADQLMEGKGKVAADVADTQSLPDDTFLEIFDNSPITGEPEQESERREWLNSPKSRGLQLKVPDADTFEEDVQMLVSIGIDEAKARATLDECGGDRELAMDKALEFI